MNVDIYVYKYVTKNYGKIFQRKCEEDYEDRRRELLCHHSQRNDEETELERKTESVGQDRPEKGGDRGLEKIKTTYMTFDFKLIISLFATALVVYGYIPYFKDIFLGKTKPHLYTWLVWTITFGTATMALWRGGGSYGAIGMVTGMLLVFSIFVLSFKYGTKNITRSDKIVLIAALLAIFVWWQLNSPLLAVLMVSVIDGLGYIPTFRKSFEEPWSETLSYWFIMALADILIIISLAEYNFLTVAYLAVLTVANLAVWFICFFRRKSISNPVTGSAL